MENILKIYIHSIEYLCDKDGIPILEQLDLEEKNMLESMRVSIRIDTH